MSHDCNPFYDEAERLKTFKDKEWPLSFLRPEDLARCGFYYTGVKDEVKCPFCNIIIFNWNDGDVPAMEHIIHSKKCSFVNGRELRNIPIKKDHEQLGLTPPRDVCGTKEIKKRDDKSVKVYLPPKHKEYVTFESRLDTFKDWPIPKIIEPASLAEAGFFYEGRATDSSCGKELIDYVICFHCGIGLCQWTEDDDAWSEHEKFSNHCNYVYLLKVGKPVGLNSIPKNDESSSSAQSVSGQVVGDTESKEPFKWLPKATDADLRCSVCLEFEVGALFFPCLHTACPPCAAALSNCPICRTPIDKVHTLSDLHEHSNDKKIFYCN